jgi:hypothetical protein
MTLMCMVLKDAETLNQSSCSCTISINFSYEINLLFYIAFIMDSYETSLLFHLAFIMDLTT